MSDSRKLSDLFDKYLDMATKKECPNHYYARRERDDLYFTAREMLKGVYAEPVEANWLVGMRELSELERELAGFFISAVYNKSESLEIVYDLGIEVQNLAFRLPREKTFVNYGRGHHFSGTFSDGLIINYMDKRDIEGICAGHNAYCTLVTFGAYAYLDACDSGEGYVHDKVPLSVSVKENVVITGLYGDPHMSNTGNIFLKGNDSITNPGRTVTKKDYEKYPGLQEYIGNLTDKFKQGRHDYRNVISAVRSLGIRPNEGIIGDIRRIIVDGEIRADASK